MKSLLLFFLVISSLFGAPSGLYIELGVGSGFGDSLQSSSSRVSYERGFIGSVAFGYQSGVYRVEIEERYKSDKLYSIADVLADGELRESSQMLNLYYSGYNDSKFVSSIGFGMGITALSIENIRQFSRNMPEIKEEGILSLQGLFSVGYQIERDITATVEYSYFYTQKSDSFGAKDESSLLFSLRYLF